MCVCVCVCVYVCILEVIPSSSLQFYPSPNLPFSRVLCKAVPKPDVTNPVSLLLYIVCRLFLFSLKFIRQNKGRKK